MAQAGWRGDQERRSATVTVARRLVVISQARDGADRDGPIFRALDRFQRVQPGRLSGKAVAHIAKRRAKAVGLEPSRYEGHSLRAGLATGASERVIASQTGHRSADMVKRYIREGSLFTRTLPLWRASEASRNYASPTELTLITGGGATNDTSANACIPVPRLCQRALMLGDASQAALEAWLSVRCWTPGALFVSLNRLLQRPARFPRTRKVVRRDGWVEAQRTRLRRSSRLSGRRSLRGFAGAR